MAEERPFDASAARVARAKREGDVPRSQDLGAVASFAFAALGVVAALPLLTSSARRALLGATGSVAPVSGAAGVVPYLTLAACALATIVCGLGGALLASYLQTRRFTLKFPAPNFEKLNPVEGLKRMLSRDSAIAGAKAVLVSAAVAAALAPAVRRSFTANLQAAIPERFGSLVQTSLETIVASAVGVAVCVAVLDLLLERAKWRRRLRMNFDELRRDQRQSEGDPQIKGRRRQAHRSLLRGSIGRVADAAFVVANPTHVAIALEYRPPGVAVPRVIVRAIDGGAVAVKRRARELRIPVIENVTLARSLLATTALGEYIPPELYGAVAAIVAVVGARAA